MNPDLTIIVPIFNEERTIAEVMGKITGTHPDAEIIYVNDGSADRSREILEANKRPNDKVITKENGGKGSAIRMGIRHANGKYTVIQDSDLEYDPREITNLLSEAEANPGSVVFGSRFLKKNPNLYKRYLIGNKLLTLILNILFGGKLTDSYTCYKLFPTTFLKSLDLVANGFEMEAELCARTLKKKIPIREVPISYHPRSIKDGKKICLRDAWKGVGMMLRIKLHHTEDAKSSRSPTSPQP